MTSINPSTRCASQTTRRARWPTAAVGSGCAALMLSLGAQGDSFARAYYDSRTDQLVVGMIYGGTNAQHAFTIRWGQCQDVGGSNWHDLAAEVLDSQWQDQAVRSYEETVRFSLAGIPCRPARVTLRTAPRFISTVVIPAVKPP